MREGPPLATPLTALPSASLYKSVKLLLLDQGSFAESELMPSLGPSLRLPPHGTVSGSALQLAARLTDGPIIAAGLDLAVYGDREHTRPNGFDPLLLQAASRASPLEGIVWSRSLEAAPQSLPKKPWRTSRALTAYASALSLDSRSLEGRLFRLGPAPFALSGFAEVDERGFEALAAVQVPREEEIFTTVFPMPRARREAIVAERIASWRSLASETSFALSQGVLPKTALVAELLRSIDIVDYAAARRAILAGGNPKSAAEELSRRCDLFLSALERRFAS